MSYELSMNNIDHIIYDPKQESFLLKLPKKLGYLKTRKEVISKDLCLMKTSIKTFEDLDIQSCTLPKSLVLRITLDGMMDFKEHSHNQKYYKNSIHIDYAKKIQGVFTIPKNKNYKSIMILMKGEFLKKFLLNNLKDEQQMEIQRNYDNNLISNLRASISNSKTAFLAKEIYNSPFKGELNSLYLQGKVYELLHNEFANLITEQKEVSSSTMKFSNADIQALHKAKKIMQTSQNKISIIELSRKVALNEHKLKYGFKKLFNTTPHSLMLERRMYEAKELLESSDLNVSEVADKVGYKYIQSFSMAFTKFFGQSPKDLMKSRKYYY